MCNDHKINVLRRERLKRIAEREYVKNMKNY